MDEWKRRCRTCGPLSPRTDESLPAIPHGNRRVAPAATGLVIMRPPPPTVFAKEFERTAMLVTPRRAGLGLGWRRNRLLGLGPGLLALGPLSRLYFWLARGKTHGFELDDYRSHTAGAINRHLQATFIALGADAPDLTRPHCHLRAGHRQRGLFRRGIPRLFAGPLLIPSRRSRERGDKSFG